MGLSGFLRGVAGALKGLSRYSKARFDHQEAVVEADVVLSEQVINSALAFATKPDSQIQKPSLKLNQDELHLHFSIKNHFGGWVMCRLPLHISELIVSKNQSVAIIERAGKARVSSESVWQLICFQFIQAYFNSARGEQKLLATLAASIKFVTYLPAFNLCGNTVRPAAIAIDINKILEERSVATYFIRYGVMNVLSIQGLREEAGQLILSLTLGETNTNAHSRRPDRNAHRFFNGKRANV